MARQEGVEPPTHSLEGCCSIHLSYWRFSPLVPRDRTAPPHIPHPRRSGRPDLNRGPPAPKAGAIPGYATPREPSNVPAPTNRINCRRRRFRAPPPARETPAHDDSRAPSRLDVRRVRGAGRAVRWGCRSSVSCSVYATERAGRSRPLWLTPCYGRVPYDGPSARVPESGSVLPSPHPVRRREDR